MPVNLGLAFAHKDGKGFNIMLQAFPLDGKIVCREIDESDAQLERMPRSAARNRRSGAGR